MTTLAARSFLTRFVQGPLPGALCVVVLVALLGLPALSWPAGNYDEMLLVVYPQRMLDGDVPYSDFSAAYGPAHWWILEGLFSVTGATLHSARLLGVAIHVLLALAVFCLALRWGRALATTCAALAAAMMFSLGNAPYAWLLSAALCLWHVVAVRRGTGRSTVVGGALAGLAISIRPDVAPLALIPAIPLLWSRHLWAHWATGIGAGLLPLLIALIRTPGPLVHDLLGGRAGQGAGQSRLPFLPHSGAARQLLAILAVTLILIVVLAVLRRTRETTSLALLAVLTLPQAFQRADVTHFTYAGLLYLPLLPVILDELISTGPRRLRHQRLVCAVTGVLLFLLGTAGSVGQPLGDQLTGRGPRSEVVSHKGRDLPLKPAAAETTRRLLTAVDQVSLPGDTVFIFDNNLVRPAVNDIGLYYLLPDLQQRARNMEITPGVTSFPGSGLAEDVLNADILILIDVSETFRRSLFPYAKDGSVQAQDAVRNNFCVIARVDYYVIHRRCRPAAGT